MIEHCREDDLCRIVLENCVEAIAVVTADGHISYANPALERLCGYTHERLSSLKIRDLLQPESSARKVSTNNSLKCAETFRGYLMRCDSSSIDVEVTCKSIPKPQLSDSTLYSVRDITEAKKWEQQLFHQATHDPLTGLPNRRLLADRLERAVAYCRRRERDVGVLFLDLDDFKKVNDNIGHSVGDQLLVEVAKRLLASVRNSDTVARIGGDEFVIIASDLVGPAAAQLLAQRLVVAFDQPFIIDENPLALSVSIGICMVPSGGVLLDNLLKKSSTAMYAAKNSGQNRVVFFGS